MPGGPDPPIGLTWTLAEAMHSSCPLLAIVASSACSVTAESSLRHSPT